MILWLIYFILALVFSALCYLTNWIVVPFANRDGELPSFFHLWQTWDNSIFCRESVECAPKFLRYDWSAHYNEYKDTTPYLKSVNRERWYCVCVNDEWTIKEILQRYACSVLWLTRNNAYGFCFYLLGKTVSPFLEVKASENTRYVREVCDSNITGAWMYKNTAPIFSAFGYVVHWNNLLGWKIDESATLDTRAMVAIRVAFFFEKEGE